MVISFIVIVAEFSTAFGAQPTSLSKPVKTFDVRPASAICRHLDTPCGIEMAAGDVDLETSSSFVAMKGKATGREALDELTHRFPKYVWVLENGVINILPKDENRMLLNGKPVLELSIQGLDLNGVRTNVAAIKACRAAGLDCLPSGSAGGTHQHPKLNLHLANTTLREALNSIVRADSKAAWRFLYDPRSKHYVVFTNDWGRETPLKSKPLR